MNFKNYLTEARLAPLYHGTQFILAYKILEQDLIMQNTSHWNMDDRLNKKHITDTKRISGVSFTRSLNYAMFYIKDRHAVSPIVFEVDQLKLSQNYKIIPLNYASLWKPHEEGSFTRIPLSKYAQENEYEEFVVGEIKPLSKYLKKVIVSDKVDLSHLLGERSKIILSHPLLYSYERKIFINGRK